MPIYRVFFERSRGSVLSDYTIVFVNASDPMNACRIGKTVLPSKGPGQCEWVAQEVKKVLKAEGALVIDPRIDVRN